MVIVSEWSLETHAMPACKRKLIVNRLDSKLMLYGHTALDQTHHIYIYINYDHIFKMRVSAHSNYLFFLIPSLGCMHVVGVASTIVYLAL